MPVVSENVSKPYAAALIRFRPILTYVPRAQCVAFGTSLDQMFRFAGFTSYSDSTQRQSGVRRFNCGNKTNRIKKNAAKGIQEKKGVLPWLKWFEVWKIQVKSAVSKKVINKKKSIPLYKNVESVQNIKVPPSTAMHLLGEWKKQQWILKGNQTICKG